MPVKRPRLSERDVTIILSALRMYANSTTFKKRAREAEELLERFAEAQRSNKYIIAAAADAEK